MNPDDTAAPAAPARPADPAGRTGLSYRAGTHAEVLDRALTALRLRLPALTTQDAADPAVALLDAWATVADIVTFYQERIAREGFLHTATERRSVLELARAIGYELAPGVAAATWLSFTVEDAVDPGARAVVPAGTRVQSIPGQGQLPQTFETAEELTARAERNAMRLRLRRTQQITTGAAQVLLDGVTTGLRPGDPLLIRRPDGQQPWQLRVLTEVEPHPADASGSPATTVVRWDEPLDLTDPEAPAVPAPVEVHAFRQRAALFGHNAPDWRLMPDTVRRNYAPSDQTTPLPTQWPGFALTYPADGGDPVLDLDAPYREVLPGSWLVLRAPGLVELYEVVTADLSAAADFGLTATTTRLRLRGSGPIAPFDRRTTTVDARSERLRLAEEPVTAPVTGTDLLLDRSVELTRGSTVVVTGSTPDGRPTTQPVTVAGSAATVDGTQLTLAEPLALPLDPASVRVLGNVVAATAGESVIDEVLGSGDGATGNQSFTLLRGDLTHTTAPVPGGVRDSLSVRVDDVEWTEAASLYELGPHDRGYVVRIGDDGSVGVRFGDGERGARLPSGQDNVRADYRSGTGPAGNVPAGALSLLPARPLGIRDVTNPLPATGGTAPEGPADGRTAAPLSVRTFDRVVSLDDHQDFARAFAGIAKATATALPGARHPFVHLTVAGPGGADVPADTLAALRAALDAAGRPPGRLGLDSYRPLAFAVAVAVLAAPDREWEQVADAVQEALRTAYSFDRGDFARPVPASGVLTLVQQVPGVLAATVRALHLGDAPDGDAVAEVLVARPARLGRTGVLPAELLLADPGRITVTELVP
ncbi:putative baseplate assembly protein [Streptomyces hyaluromycini]|uniref:putative baseplate assembly protein n=1 Tax=Streptomyces hyaluromycini TaxID=1377993 RepID=UPI00142D3E04|nr:putative baseplate assembly protein [Streptomyces hyaluromycini]